MGPDYKEAYNVLMDYWDCIPEEERVEVSKKIDKALNPLDRFKKLLAGANNNTITKALRRLGYERKVK